MLRNCNNFLRVKYTYIHVNIYIYTCKYVVVYGYIIYYVQSESLNVRLLLSRYNSS